MILEEEQLINRLVNKDPEALAHLYDQYSAALYGVVLRTIRNKDLAEEVLVDSFLTIWCNIESYNPEHEKLFCWMLKITKNVAVDKIRTRESNTYIG